MRPDGPVTLPGPTSAPLVEITALETGYQGLRPLRIRQLVVRVRERVALAGLDAAAAEVLMNLLAGATLPDEGMVRVFGVPTGEIETPDQWLESLERLGMVSHRAVLLDGMSVIQNVALSLTLQLEPVPEEFGTRARALAEEVGISADAFDHPVGDVAVGVRYRVHLARAVAVDPSLLLLEHPTAGMLSEDATLLAADVARVAETRGMAVLAVTNDEAFAWVSCHRPCRLRPSTGDVEALDRRPWTRWLRRRGWPS